jgi:hypothetical protein
METNWQLQDLCPEQNPTIKISLIKIYALIGSFIVNACFVLYSLRIIVLITEFCSVLLPCGCFLSKKKKILQVYKVQEITI